MRMAGDMCVVVIYCKRVVMVVISRRESGWGWRHCDIKSDRWWRRTWSEEQGRLLSATKEYYVSCVLLSIKLTEQNKIQIYWSVDYTLAVVSFSY